MKYKIEMVIDESIQKVFELYTTEHHFKNWEKGLDRIESEHKEIFIKDAISYLIFKNGSQEMNMRMTIKDYTYPTLIDIIYEVEGAYNLCENRFIDQKQSTKWVMDVTFKFDQHMDVSKERFIEKTTMGMNMFKAYVESQKNT